MIVIVRNKILQSIDDILEKKKINIDSNISYKLINILDEFLEQQPKVTKQFDNGETGYWVQRGFEYIKRTGEFE